MSENFDPFIAELDEMQTKLNRMRDTYIMMRHDFQDAANGIYNPNAEVLTVGEVARVLSQEEMTIRGGVGGTNCLYQTRIKDGRSVRYPRAAVEIHQRNRHTRGSCGSCNTEYRKQNEHKMK